MYATGEQIRYVWNMKEFLDREGRECSVVVLSYGKSRFTLLYSITLLIVIRLAPSFQVSSPVNTGYFAFELPSQRVWQESI